MKTPPLLSRRPSPSGPDKPKIDWRKFIWPTVFFFLVTWIWQEGLKQAIIKTIPYSEFKQLLSQGEVAGCSITDTEIDGSINPARHVSGNTEPAGAAKTPLSAASLQDAFEKVVAGPERKSRRLGEEEKRRVAYHEVGHALIAAFTEHGDHVSKISIVPRGRSALGYTLQLPTEQQFLMTRAEILERVSGLLGGRAAEELVFGDITTGAENDLERATAMVRQMICVYGMSETIGLAHLAHRPDVPYLNGADGSFQRDCSDDTARLIDQEVKQLLAQTYNFAKSILAQHRDLLERISSELLKSESLDGETFYRLVGSTQPPSSQI